MIKLGEYLPDLPDLDSPGICEAHNVIPKAIGYGSFPSKAAETSGLTGTPLGAIGAKDVSGNGFLYAGDDSVLYSKIDGVWTDVKVSGGYSATESWEFTKWGEQIIAVSYTQVPQVITMGGANFANLAGTPPRGRHVAVVGDFVVIGNTTTGTVNGSNVVFWSDINDETNWSTGQSDYQELQGNGGHIQRIVGGDYGVILQESSIWRMDFVGPPFAFQFSEVENSRGTPAPNSVINFGNAVFYLGQDDFYLFNGSGSIPIGVNKITQTFFEDLNNAEIAAVSGAIDVERQLLIWAYPSGSETKPDKAMLYHWPTKRWATADLSCEFLFAFVGQGYTMEGLDNISTDLDSFTISLDSKIWQGGALLIGGFDQSKKLFTLDGAAQNATFTTGEMQIAQGQRALVTEVRPLVDGASPNVSIGHRSRQEDARVWSDESSVNAAGFCPTRVNNRYMKFKLTLTADFTSATGLEVKAVGRGIR